MGRFDSSNPTLMSKLAKHFGNKRENVNVMVSKKANKLGISAEAALIVLAKENGIGTVDLPTLTRSVKTGGSA